MLDGRGPLRPGSETRLDTVRQPWLTRYGQRMRAAYVSAVNADDPLSALEVGERPEPALPADDWVTVEVRASSLNHHDLWSLQGVGFVRRFGAQRSG